MASTGSNYIIKFSTSLLLAVLTVLTCIAQEMVSAFKDFSFHDADLIFVAPPTANAITDVTCYASETAVDHVAIIHYIGGEYGLPYVIEAIGNSVCLTPLDSFIVHNKDCQLIVTRIPNIDASPSIRNALKYVGSPYDDLYLPNDSAIYCSELVQLSFVDTNGNNVFSTIPMSFHDSTGKITDFWKQHYARHGLQVPEGKPGTNPVQLLNHPTLRIIARFPQ